MSNKIQLQTNNASLDGYIARINAAKEVAAGLPNAGGGGSIETCTLSLAGDFGFAYNKIVDGNITTEYIEGNVSISEAIVPCSSIIVVYDYLLMSGVTTPTTMNNISVIYDGTKCAAGGLMSVFQVSSVANSNCVLSF